MFENSQTLDNLPQVWGRLVRYVLDHACYVLHGILQKERKACVCETVTMVNRNYCILKKLAKCYIVASFPGLSHCPVFGGRPERFCPVNDVNVYFGRQRGGHQSKECISHTCSLSWTMVGKSFHFVNVWNSSAWTNTTVAAAATINKLYVGSVAHCHQLINNSTLATIMLCSD